MCSELFRIPIEIAGVPLFGVGVLLALWLVVAVWGVAQLSRKGAPRGDVVYAVAMLGIVAAMIVLLPKLFPDGLPIRGYGVMLLVGGLSGVMLAAHRARQVGLHPDVIYSLAIYLFVAGILGARLFYVIEYWETRFSRAPLVEVFKFTEGGLVVYGALIGAAIAFVLFVRRNKLHLLAMADLIAPSLAVGLAFGRIGCLLNGCCYGGLSDEPWAVRFPIKSPPYSDQIAKGQLKGALLDTDAQGRLVVLPADGSPPTDSDVVVSLNGTPVASLPEANRILFNAFTSGEDVRIETLRRVIVAPSRSEAVHPTQVYSAINAALLGWFLWTYYPFRRRDGEVTGLMLTIYPIARFIIEDIREDESAIFGTGLSISQNLSIGLLALMVAYWLWLVRRPWTLAFAKLQ
jgi:phosphatidylglycerol:prolipoprotein diacylglycerol transferase